MCKSFNTTLSKDSTTRLHFVQCKVREAFCFLLSEYCCHNRVDLTFDAPRNVDRVEVSLRSELVFMPRRKLIDALYEMLNYSTDSILSSKIMS